MGKNNWKRKVALSWRKLAYMEIYNTFFKDTQLREVLKRTIHAWRHMELKRKTIFFWIMWVHLSLFFFFISLFAQGNEQYRATTKQYVCIIGKCVHDWVFTNVITLHLNDYQSSFSSPPHAPDIPNRAAFYQDRPYLISCSLEPVRQVEGLLSKLFCHSLSCPGELLELLFWRQSDKFPVFYFASS